VQSKKSRGIFLPIIIYVASVPGRLLCPDKHKADPTKLWFEKMEKLEPFL
jgi:hypothetical protein